jgi:hypothetical protein
MSVSESMKGNKNAEKWTEEKAIEIFNKALELAKQKEDYVIYGKTVKGFSFHFIGEIADELDQYLELFTYLRNKFDSCMELYNRLKTRCERNCFSDSKKGIIKEATAIMNLKSNYGWSDRQSIDHTNDGKAFNSEPAKITFVDKRSKK